MEYTIKNKLLALIFPMLCMVYGLFELRYGSFASEVFTNTIPILSILGGIITGMIAVLMKIDFEPYLKVLTIGTVITYLFYILIVLRFSWFELGEIFHVVILIVAVFLMTVKMPDEASARDRLVVTFANPVLYSMLNKLCGLLLSYLRHTGAIE